MFQGSRVGLFCGCVHVNDHITLKTMFGINEVSKYEVYIMGHFVNLVPKYEVSTI